MKTETTKNFITVTRTVEATDQNLDDIMSTALEGGICYWCYKVEVDDYHGAKYASDAVSKGATMSLFDSEDGKKYTLTKKDLLKGVAKYLEAHPEFHVDHDQDAGSCDEIVQYALFGEAIYG